MTRGRLVWALTLSIVIGMAALAVVLILIGDDLRAIPSMRLPWLAAAVAFLAGSFSLAGARLGMLVHRGGAGIPFHHAVRAHVLGLFASTVTPGGSGGMPAVALTLARQGVPKGLAWASAVGATAADLVLFGWSIPVALLGLHLAGALPPSNALRIAAAAMSVVALATAVLLTLRLRWTRTLARRALRGRLARYLEPVERFLDDLLEANGSLRAAPLRWHLRFHATVACGWWSFFAVLWACARGFGVEAPAAVVIAALTLVQGIGAVVPTPGGSGYFELGASWALASQGGRAGVVGAVVVWRLLCHYALFLLGPTLGGYLLARAPYDASSLHPPERP